MKTWQEHKSLPKRKERNHVYQQVKEGDHGTGWRSGASVARWGGNRPDSTGAPRTSYVFPRFHTSAHMVSQTGHEQEFVGIVQSIDQAKQTFQLQPSSQGKAVAIAYDHRTVQLTVGMHIVAHVMTRSDGSLYAAKIEPVAAHGNGVPASVQSDSYPAWRDGPCGWRDHHGPGYHH